MIGNALMQALRAIRRNVLRSFLTILGIVIGVAAVIIMVTLGGGATVQVTQQIASLGSNLLMVRPGQRLGPGLRSPAAAFTIRDVEAMRKQLPALAAVAPTASRGVTLVYGNTNYSSTVSGTENAFFTVRNWTLAAGREFTAAELRGGSAVCIIGDTVRRELFGGQQPLGAKIRIDKVSCDVIGLLEPKGQTSMGADQDDLVVMPLRAFWRRIAGNQDVNFIQVSARQGVDTQRVKRDIELLMRERRHILRTQDDDFTVLDMKEIAKTLSGATQVLTALLSAVAAVSLLVGGIGIMNIMLVSVTERTREIGIRLAIGALERDVLLQFLVEAVVLSSLGGVVGIVLAIAVSIGAASALRLPFIFNGSIVALAFFFSAAVGVVFGYFPARKAARLDPIDALRYE